MRNVPPGTHTWATPWLSVRGVPGSRWGEGPGGDGAAGKLAVGVAGLVGDDDGSARRAVAVAAGVGDPLAQAPADSANARQAAARIVATRPIGDQYADRCRFLAALRVRSRGMESIRFRSEIRHWNPATKGGLAVADIPTEHIAAIGGLKQQRVHGRIGTSAFTSNVMPAGGGRLALSISKAMQRAAQVGIGDSIEVEISAVGREGPD
jgi:hypothetical protein